MPAAVQGEAPSISRIYVAFDDDCYRVFRRAMARSRGGVVRVEDLLAALAETIPGRTAAVLGLDAAAVARLARPPVAGPDLLPMSNEPALRSVLAGAFAEADGRPLTPTMLLRAVARSPSAIRRPWREAVPAPTSAPVRSPPPPVWPPPADAVQAVLRRWLEVQAWPAAARDSALQALAMLAPPRLESNACLDPPCSPVEMATDAPAD